jgi:hypothetical protein
MALLFHPNALGKKQMVAENVTAIMLPSVAHHHSSHLCHFAGWQTHALHHLVTRSGGLQPIYA